MKKVIYILITVSLMLTISGCGKQKELGDIGSLIVAQDESAIEKIEKLKAVDDYIDYDYIDIPEGIIDDSDKGDCINLLSLACAVGNEDAINKLLEMGANPAVQLEKGAGAYPIEYFCQYGYASGSYILEKLIDAGANMDNFLVEKPVFRLVDNLKTDPENAEILTEEILIIVDGEGSWTSESIRHDGDSLIHAAATIEDGDLLETLLEYDKSIDYINAKNAAGSTPLMSAVKAGCWNNVVALVVHGVDRQIRDDSGMTAQDLAKLTGDKTILKIFDMAEGLQ